MFLVPRIAPPRLLRLLFAAAALAAGAAQAQQEIVTPVSPALEVQRLAPQLVAFAGSNANFENLVNGLAFGLPVTLSTTLPTGQTQLVTFTPTGTLSPLQIAQTLENARQVAIGNGIAVPTAGQLGAILNGGTLSTAAGQASVNGLIGANPVTTSLTQPSASGAQQTSPAAILQSQPRFQTSRDPTPGNVSDSPLLPGVAQSPASPAPNAAAASSAPKAVPPAARSGAAR